MARRLGASIVDHLPRHDPATQETVSHLPVELFGVPRLLAGKRAVMASGATLAELAADLVRRQPELAGCVLDAATGWPLAGYCFVVDERFTREQMMPIDANSTVILVSSTAGG